MIRALWTISLKIMTYPGVWTICRLLLYVPEIIGGPELKPRMHRSTRLRSSGSSKTPALVRAARAAIFARVAAENGMRPSGGSMMSDVRRSAVSWLPRSYQKSL
jgi:hypothetical protein